MGRINHIILLCADFRVSLTSPRKGSGGGGGGGGGAWPYSPCMQPSIWSIPKVQSSACNLQKKTQQCWRRVYPFTGSRADLARNCAFRDKSMKLGTWFLDILRSILRSPI